jgi:hypothetical protein
MFSFFKRLGFEKLNQARFLNAGVLRHLIYAVIEVLTDLVPNVACSLDILRMQNIGFIRRDSGDLINARHSGDSLLVYG